MNRPFRNLKCAVCGSDTARFNYQALTCEKCRVFFFRIISYKPDLPHCDNNCTYIHSCVVIPPKARFNCKSCRFRNCLAAGMREEDVGLRTAKNGTSLPLLPVNYSSVMAVFYPVADDPTITEIDYKICYCRTATAYAEFLGVIEEFHQMESADQVIFFRSNIMLYTLLEVLYRTVVCLQNNSSLYKHLPYTTNISESHWKERRAVYRARNSASICTLFSLNLSLQEYLLVRIIAMFTNGIMLSPPGQLIALRAKDKYTVMLAELIRYRASPEVTLGMVAKILELLKDGNEYTLYGRDVHATMVVNNYDQMAGQLTEEILITGSVLEKKRVKTTLNI